MRKPCKLVSNVGSTYVEITILMNNRAEDLQPFEERKVIRKLAEGCANAITLAPFLSVSPLDIRARNLPRG